MKLKYSKTNRGFRKITFKDFYGKESSIQKSSIATEDAIWIGLDNPEPQIMVSDAKQLGIETNLQNGWMPYPIPPQVLISTTMHLTRKQIKKLLPVLEYFAKTGTLPNNEMESS